jgi:hypothetical protein
MLSSTYTQSSTLYVGTMLVPQTTFPQMTPGPDSPAQALGSSQTPDQSPWLG